jgi:uncharacterized protein YhbP (UPF0306 family)
MQDELRQTVLAFLQQHHVMTLATQGSADSGNESENVAHSDAVSDGGPWAAAVFYAHDATTLYFLSSARSRHARDLARDARVAVSIQSQPADWKDIRGIQLQGRAVQLEGAERLAAMARYGLRFPIVGNLARAPAAIAQAFAKVSWYRIDAKYLFFIDNSKGFGHRDRLDLG